MRVGPAHSSGRRWPHCRPHSDRCVLQIGTIPTQRDCLDNSGSCGGRLSGSRQNPHPLSLARTYLGFAANHTGQVAETRNKVPALRVKIVNARLHEALRRPEVFRRASGQARILTRTVVVLPVGTLNPRLSYPQPAEYARANLGCRPDFRNGLRDKRLKTGGQE